MEARTLKISWWITALVALLLLIATLLLAVRAHQIEETGILAYVAGSQTATFLRDQPSNSGAVLTVLENGSPVRINDSTTQSNIDWYYVAAGETSGWLRASSISLDPP